MLTSREQEILDACNKGLSLGQIASQLGLSYLTVKTYKKKINAKLKEKKVDKKEVDLVLQDQLAHFKRETESYKRAVAFDDKVLALFREGLRRADNVKLFGSVRKPLKGKSEECVLLLSDWHVGEEVTLDETLGIGEYNVDVLTRRIQKMHDAIDSIMCKMKGYSYAKLNIMLLGDMVSGIIHQELIQGTAAVDQVIIGAELICTLIQKLSNHFKEIDVDCVIGNHGRMTQKPTFKNRYNNFDYLMYKYIEIKFENVPSVKVNVPKSPFIVKTIQDWNFLLLHGDGIKGFAGIPYYGMRRMDSQMSQLLVTQKDTYPHYICIGHFHDANSLSKIGGRIIMNGSVKGADGFSIGKMFTASEPSQTIFSVHPDHGITWSFNLHID